MATHSGKWLTWNMVPTNKKRLLVLRVEVRGQRGVSFGVILDLSGGASGKMNRNFQTSCTYKSPVTRSNMCIERILSALY